MKPSTPISGVDDCARQLNIANTIVNHTDSYRLVYSEGDLLVVVDHRTDIRIVLFVQDTVRQGMDRIKSLGLNCWLRNSTRPRSSNAMIPRFAVWKVCHSRTQCCTERPSPISYDRNGLRFAVDIIAGQKTGSFLDQREKPGDGGSAGKGTGVRLFYFSRICSQ